MQCVRACYIYLMINQILKILNFRLIEFGDTPSSALTLEEFMTVDLEEEQDPPAFKAARKKDRERLQKVKKKKKYVIYLKAIELLH